MEQRTSPMQLRDSDELPLRVSRTIPVWALISGLIAIVAQAVALQLGQVRQGELIAAQSKEIAAQSVTIKELSAKVEGVAEKTQDAKYKTANYEFRLEDLDRRLSSLERGRKP